MSCRAVLVLALFVAPFTCALKLKTVSNETGTAAPMEGYRRDCWKKIARSKFGSSSLAQSPNGGAVSPGAGIEGFKPYELVLKDGFMNIDCTKDDMFWHGDKFGDNRAAYAEGGISNVSIVHYAAHVPKLERKPMTRNVCFEFCRTVPDMGYFGITNGRECYCTPYYKAAPGDSSLCDLPCDGDKQTTCGGKSKSAIFGMHWCDSTEADLKEVSFHALMLAGDLDNRVFMATDLSESMQKAAAENQKVFGAAGDPAASDLMQNAKVFAGDLQKAADDTDSFAKKLGELVKGSRSLKKFTDPATVTKAERLMEAMTEQLGKGAESSTDLGDVIALAAPGQEEEGEALQYYPIMYFVDKKYENTMQTCSGDTMDKPIVGESMDGCAAACDDAMTCVGFSYFGTADDTLCFLFSSFSSAVYYTGCEKDKKGALIEVERTRGEVTVQPWRCGRVSQPFQVMNDKKGAHVYALDVGAGEYKTLFDVEPSWLKPEVRALNACAINPVDSILYCHAKLKDKTSYIVRIDNTKIGVVAKAPAAGSFAGTFDMDGTLYAYGRSLGLYMIEGIDKMPAYDSVEQAVKPKFSSYKKAKFGGDLAAVEADFDGTGVKKYVLSQVGAKLAVVQVSPKPFKQWVITVPELKGNGKAFGGAWTFRNEIYFSANSGKGVYQLDLNTVDLKNKKAKFVKAGSSKASKSNDGVNCMLGRSPFPTVVEPPPVSAVGGAPTMKPRKKEEAPKKEKQAPLDEMAVPPKTGEVRCMAKLTEFQGINLTPDKSGKCKFCLKKLTKADRCY